jgi:hypothetical protein
VKDNSVMRSEDGELLKLSEVHYLWGEKVHG